MLLEAWSIGLLSGSAVSLFLAFIGTLSAIRVIRSWDIGSDSEIQIQLEEHVWLTAAVVQFALVLQVIGILLLVLAADNFSTILKGAMCATGALTANSFGLPILLVRLLALFLSVIWLVLHRLDISSQAYPLVRLKFALLLFLFPILFLDFLFLVLYLGALDPDIVTSCCGVLFSRQDGDGYNLLGPLDSSSLLIWYGVSAVITMLSSALLSVRGFGEARYFSIVYVLNGLGWLLFYVLSLVVITVVVSPYVYGMPHHRCPFDLIQPPYFWLGYPLYVCLHIGVFAGLGASVSGCVERMPGLFDVARGTRLWAARLSLASLAIFFLLAGWKPFIYIISGGQ